jgi:hypothetical protein
MIIVCCLLLTSCTHNIYDKQLDQYNRLVSELKNTHQISTDIPFDINAYFEKITDDEVTYRVIIDNPRKDIRNIKAVVVHDHKTNDIYPTSGIFESPLNLVPDVVDITNNYAKGVILVGYIDYNDNIDDFKITIKVLVQYEDSNGDSHDIYYEYHK